MELKTALELAQFGFVYFSFLCGVKRLNRRNKELKSVEVWGFGRRVETLRKERWFNKEGENLQLAFKTESAET